MIDISIIVPVYNVSAFVTDCLESIAASGIRNAECIIVDDCGSDDSAAKAKEWVAKYDGDIDFRMLAHERNRGVSAARNTGLSVAQGRYVLFFDSDDLMLPGALGYVVEVMDEHNLDIARLPQLISFSEDETREKREEAIAASDGSVSYVVSGVKFLEDDFNTKSCHPPTSVYRHKLIAGKVTFEEGVTMEEDLLFAYNAYLHASRVAYVQTNVCLYRIHSGSVVQSASLRSLESMCKVMACLGSVGKDSSFRPYQRFLFSVVSDFFYIMIVNPQMFAERAEALRYFRKHNVRIPFSGEPKQRFIALLVNFFPGIYLYVRRMLYVALR